jgi:hypothetical protein
MQQYTYQPKGGMCRSCKMIKDDCSKLDFKSMPVIYRAISEPITYVVVKCTNFERKFKNGNV